MSRGVDPHEKCDDGGEWVIESNDAIGYGKFGVWRGFEVTKSETLSILLCIALLSLNYHFQGGARCRSG